MTDRSSATDSAVTDSAKIVAFTQDGCRVIVMDTISLASAEDAGQVIITGSHGGMSAGEYARQARVACVICNDAGFGKNNAGVAGLCDLDRDGIAGVAVGHLTARLGDGNDVWSNGVVSFVNETAKAAGFAVGWAIQDQVRRYLGGRSESGLPGEGR
ncbi:hypothetical protein ACFFX1_52290 [Dactylosporangium sucinum]|uniref:Uncharacterized protein n=1 Tax=Dactylosporangium sucinum TaxID=1424081 RepID=A0A917WWJ9_9ACTN|nr:hypothetical protein [Dactylosporangium sucinum]GGM35612.1 hypothetical protein GCM10007977_041280 [Dactylosporangium sucinum]